MFVVLNYKTEKKERLVLVLLLNPPAQEARFSFQPCSFNQEGKHCLTCAMWRLAAAGIWAKTAGN